MILGWLEGLKTKNEIHLTPLTALEAVCSGSLSDQVWFWLDLKMYKLWKQWLNEELQNIELITSSFCMDVRNPKPRLPEVSRSSAESKSLWSLNYSQILRVFKVNSCKARVCQTSLLSLAGRHHAQQDWVHQLQKSGFSAVGQKTTWQAF